MIEQILRTEVPDPELKACDQCFHCRGAISWWCQNKEAIKARGTKIPDCQGCPFWKPARQWKDLYWWEKLMHDAPWSNIMVF